jgi:epoxyqueuosine reductase
LSLPELRSSAVKRRARELGVHLVGVARAEALAGTATPPDAVLRGARSVVVLARRLLRGAARIGRPDSRAAHYSAEIALSELEQQAMELCLWLEAHGHPSLVLPASANRSVQEDMRREGPIDLIKAATAAGLGTMGLTGQLLTPEFGPRVALAAVLTYAALEPDAPHTQALCLGERCGRCVSVCPGGAGRQWGLDVERCRPHSSPYGYHFFERHLRRIDAEKDPERRWELARSSDTLMIWQSMLRGVGVLTGCTRCLDVCPVGADYQEHLADALDELPANVVSANAGDLEAMRQRAASGDRGPAFRDRREEIGSLQGGSEA